MKSIKLMGVAVVAALAVMAFVGAATASADTVCTENASPCPVAKRITTLTGQTTSGKKAVLTSGSFKVECDSETTATGLTSLGAHLGVSGSVTALTFTNCTGSCTGATAVNLPYHAHGTAVPQTVTVTSGGTGNPGATLTNCLGLGVSCTFTTASAVLNFDGGTPGSLTANGIPLTRTSGLCPATGSWTAQYDVTNHTSAFLVTEP
jgi:hypothetical protein